MKNIPSIKFLAQFIVKNIIAVLNGQAPTDVLPKKLPIFVAISVGPNFGIFVMNGNVMPGENNGQGKFSFSKDYIKMFAGDMAVINGQKAYLDNTYKDLAAQI